MAADINLTPTASFFEINGSEHPGGGKFPHGPSMPVRTWGSPGDCQSAALLIHGLGAHSGWFEALGRRLKVRRIFALSYDQLGFGKRQAEVFRTYQQWLADLTVAYNHLYSIIGSKPIYLMGNTWEH